MKKILALFLFAVFLKQLAWQAFIPIWQTPDEQAHFGQVQNFVETSWQNKPVFNLSREIWISEVILGTDRDEYGNNKYTYHPEYKSPYAVDLENQISHQPISSRTEYVKNEATGYPPLYYSLAGLVYRVFYSGTIFDRVFAVRIISSLSLVALTYAAYLIGKCIFKEEGSALALATLVGFHPMLTFVHAGVTSDTLFNLLFAAFLLACLRRSWILMVIIFALSLLTKPQAYIMGFVALPLIFSRPLLVFAGLLLFLPLVKFVSLDKLVVPETGGIKFADIFSGAFLEHLKFTAVHTYREVLPWFWGVFRWLSLGLPDILRKITNWLTVLSVAGFAVYLLRNVNRKLLFLLYSLLIYFLAITLFDFGFRQTHGYSFGIQGRYFFPVIIPFMVVFLTGLKPLGRLLPMGMIIFNIIVFFWVMGSYYELSWPAFFVQASQYKPVWLKYPLNLIILSQYLLWSLLSLRLIMKRG